MNMNWIKNKMIFYYRLYKLKKWVIGFNSTLKGEEPRAVTLQIFRNENKHEPFYPICTPARENSLTVEVYDYATNPNGILVKSYKANDYYLDNFGELLVKEGVAAKKTAYNIYTVCTTETYNQISG